jgi:hypothetical protein
MLSNDLCGLRKRPIHIAQFIAALDDTGCMAAPVATLIADGMIIAYVAAE